MNSSMENSSPLFRVTDFEVFADGLDHPEGLAFDCDGNLWCGGELGQIYCIDQDSRVSEVANLGGFSLGLTFSPEEHLYVCNFKLHSLIELDRRGNVLSSLDCVGDRKLITPNFSVFTRDGDLYFSDSGDWDNNNGCIYRLRKSGRAEWFAGPFDFPNGLALSADERLLFVAQSQQDNVLRIPILPDGVAGAPEIYAAGLARVPDGLALDALGNLYVMCYASDCIYRVSPQRRIELLAYDPTGTRISRPTNAAFGGPDSQDLFVAHLGRWHISRIHLGIAGQPLANMQDESKQAGAQ
jgi:gluconolactonase